MIKRKTSHLKKLILNKKVRITLRPSQSKMALKVLKKKMMKILTKWMNQDHKKIVEEENGASQK